MNRLSFLFELRAFFFFACLLVRRASVVFTDVFFFVFLFMSPVQLLAAFFFSVPVNVIKCNSF